MVEENLGNLNLSKDKQTWLSPTTIRLSNTLISLDSPNIDGAYPPNLKNDRWKTSS